jgi:hypothetical protein
MDQGIKLIVNGQQADGLLDKDGHSATDLSMATAYTAANITYTIVQGDQVVFRQSKQF